MNSELKQYLKLTRSSIIFWSFAMFCYVIFRYLGLEGEMIVGETSVPTQQIRFTTLALISLLIGAIMGVFYATIEFYFEKSISKRLSLGTALILENTVAFISTIIIFTISQTIISDIFNIEISRERFWWVKDHSFWSLIVYIGLASFVSSFLKIASERFGPGVFIKILLGRYKKPLEEKRIFMFLDLKGSTSIAEQLGHFKHSQFIQDCFFDLNGVVMKYNAEIYQYVGDEAVLSWPYQKGINNNNCIEVFFAFQNKIEEKKDYYLKTYGIVPEFKSGVHGGTLMATEIGYIKKELAYHGDVINTASRIQGKCNLYQVNILLSESLMQDLNIVNPLDLQVVDNVILKGKKQPIKVFTIQT